MGIITRLKRTGITFKVVGNKLRLAPKDKITHELLDKIIRHKKEIVTYLLYQTPNMLVSAIFTPGDKTVWN